MTPVPSNVLEAARTAAADANVRFAAGDFTVTEAEGVTIVNLVAAMKAAGVSSPAQELLDVATSPKNARTG